MSCKQIRETTLFLFVVYFCTFRLCHSVSLLQWEDGLTTYQDQESNATRWEQDNDVQQGHWPQVEQVILSPNLRKVSAPTPGATDNNLSWIIGHISKEPKPWASHSDDGYQADFTGFDGVKGNILGPSSDSSPDLFEWLAMKTLVQCDDDVMTFTASGGGFIHLLVDRDGASPISLFQLPSYCGYSVRASWSDLEMMVPYDACYITQENGSYVLPMLWWGHRLKLSCPVQTSAPPPFSAPLVFCSPYGMAVQIYGQEEDIAMLRTTVNGGWHPFVSDECAYRVYSNPGELNFFIFYSALCIASGDGPQLHLALDGQNYILSCPVHAQFPYVTPPPPSPGDPQYPYIPDPVSPAPTSPPPPPPQPPTQEQIVQLPEYPQYPYPGFQFPQLPQLYPPGPQPARPPQPTPGSPPGPQPQKQQFFNPSGPAKLPHLPGNDPKHPPSSPNLNQVQDNSLHQVSELPVGQYPSDVYYVPYYYPAAHPATQPITPPVGHYHPQYYHQIPYNLAPTAAPVTQAPAPLPPSPPSLPSAPPKQPVDSQYPFYPHSSLYHYGQFLYPKHGLEPLTIVPPSPPPPPTTTVTTMMMVPKQPGSPSYPFSQFYPQTPIYFPPPTPPPPAKEKPQDPQKPAASQATCPPYTHTICGYYPYPYHPFYYPLPYPPVPQYLQTPPPMTTMPSTTTTTPTTTTTTPSTTSSTASMSTVPTPQVPQLQCLMGRMIAFLPFAHPDSIQVKDQTKTWIHLSSVSTLCGYMIQMAEDSGVILHSPLPACHSVPRTPTTISLPVRFWDTSRLQYRTLDLQCPYQTTPEPVTPSVSPTPTSSTTTVGKIVPKPKVFCSSHQMSVELPSGPISGIVVKDIKGNQMNLQDAPKHCGYSARKGKDGKIHLRLQLHSRCHMSVQGKMYIITVVYVTVNGRQEAQLFCPVLIPGSGQECNLPSEQRLPCGRGSVSQSQCLSMGCCFSKQPPACYYPMDECTIDRHFVFSVPASLTEPPLSPALLVAANNSTCKPERVTSDYALFKIPMDQCGTRRVMVGKMMIYIVEVINKVQAISLNYGTITRDSPVRLFVECRYLPNTVLSVSYMVKTPTLGPAVQTQGVFGVQLRIAKDAQYSSYYPQYHQPLQMLLGKPLHLEVRLLNAPDPNLVLLVHFCVAYPRSGKAVWLLLYNGCPNPLDPAPQQAVVFDPQPPSPKSQTRRFTISTFQFLPDGEFKDPDEEIYFMCSTEICSPHDGPCVEGCFGQ